MKRITSMLDVQADRVDNPVGTRNGGLDGALVVCICGDLFEAIALGPPRMPWGDAHRGAGPAQMVRDSTANKPSPAEHRYAANFSIHPVILRDALNWPVKRRPHCLSRLCRGATLVDMMRDHIDQDLRCGADRLPLLLSLIDERLSFSVHALRLFDNRLGPIEKINQRLGRWQRFLNLPELCITETGKVTNEVN
jgi:hypothetical protein